MPDNFKSYDDPVNLDGRAVEIMVRNDNNIVLKGYHIWQTGDQLDNKLTVIIFSGSGSFSETCCADMFRGYFKPQFNPYAKGVCVTAYRRYFPRGIIQNPARSLLVAPGRLGHGQHPGGTFSTSAGLPAADPAQARRGKNRTR